MKHRLFVVINIPEELKGIIISKFLPEIDSGNLRWIPETNWHLTITFLGYQPEESIKNILSAISNLAQNNPAPIIELESIKAVPPESPRMIWISGDKKTSQILGRIKINLEKLLSENGIKFQRNFKSYNSHITLARFSEPINIPKIILPLKLKFKSKSIELMESHLSPAGAKYKVIESMDFN